tara:strand:- start:293 stop:1114 length:822 start_codon:yes stop_codon:yes gene_type:complete
MYDLELKDVKLKFGGLVVLDHVSLGVRAGELLALVGPNGAGKTSIFNCISGIYRPSGEISFLNTSLIGKKPSVIAALGIGRTFQHAEIIPKMNARENLLLARHNYLKATLVEQWFRLPSVRREEAENMDIVNEVLGLLSLSHLAHLPVGSLPFGIQKVIGFGRALVADPKILLMDEPSAGLTQEEREDLAYHIETAKKRLGIPMLWIEHDMEMVSAIADRVHVLDYGRSIGDGPPQDVLNDPEVIRAYLGTTKLIPSYCDTPVDHRKEDEAND